MMNSPFIDILNTNAVPSDKDVPAIKSLIKEKEKALVEVQRALKAMEELQELHTTYIQAHQALISPIKRVPVDILRSVFLIYASDGRACLQEASIASRNQLALVPVPISHVCRSWRQLSLDTPLLWNKLDLYLPVITNEIPERTEKVESWLARLAQLKDVFETCIARSVGCPLSLRLSGWYGISDDTAFDGREILVELVDVLCNVSESWKDIHFDFALSGVENPFFPLIVLPPERLPMLEDVKLSVRFYSFWSSPPLNDPALMECIRGLMPRLGVFKAPLLRNVSMSQLWLPIWEIPTNFSTLTGLSFGGYIMEDDTSAASALPAPPPFRSQGVIALLKACPKLIRCALHLTDELETFEIEPDTVIREKITHSSLQSMWLHFDTLPASFAPSLALPSLHTLTLAIGRIRHWQREASSKGVLSCISCYGKTLTTLTFHYTMLTNLDLPRCLEFLPTIVTLRLLSYPLRTSSSPSLFTTEVLNLLTPKFDESGCILLETCYCPNLENFSIKLSMREEFTEDDLIRFVAARRSPGTGSGGAIARLRDLRVSFPTPETLGVVRTLKEMGVDVEYFSVKLAFKNPSVPADGLTYYPPYIHSFDSEPGPPF